MHFELETAQTNNQSININQKELQKKRAQKVLQRAVVLGRQGKLRISPEIISISATRNCNLRCIMCDGHGENKYPSITLQEFEGLIAPLKEACHWGSPKSLDMTDGELTLNKELGSIHEYFKKSFPNATITMITNGTTPPTGPIRNAFYYADSIGFSLDGATKATFERIRQNACYDRVLANIKEVLSFTRENSKVQILFVAQDQSIKEFPDVITLAGDLGISEVFIQKVEVRGPRPYCKDEKIGLTIPTDELKVILLEAQSRATKKNIILIMTDELKNIIKDTSFLENGEENQDSDREEAIKMCHYAWTVAPGLRKEIHGNISAHTVCCHMPFRYPEVDLKSKPEFNSIESVLEAFNSQTYWDIREYFLNGSAARTFCKNCQYYRGYNFTVDQIDSLEQVINELT